MEHEHDPDLSRLIAVLDKLPGLTISSSSHGCDEHSMLWREKYGVDTPHDRISITLKPPKNQIDSEAYASIEWLAWLVYKGALQGDDLCPDLEFRPWSAIPYFNGPTECLRFVLEGTVQDPNGLADKIDSYYQETFKLPQ